MAMSSRVHVAATVLALLQASLAGFVEDLAVEDTWLNQLTDCSFAAVTNWTCGLPCEKVKELPARMIATNEKEKTMAHGPKIGHRMPRRLPWQQKHLQRPRGRHLLPEGAPWLRRLQGPLGLPQRLENARGGRQRPLVAAGVPK